MPNKNNVKKTKTPLIKKIAQKKLSKKEQKKEEKKEGLEKVETSFDKTHSVEKLSLLFIIVNKGQAIGINKILKDCNCSFFCSMFGNGTANRYLDDLISSTYDSSKEVVLSIVTESVYKMIKPKIENRFTVSEATKGILFKIDFSKMVSVFSYRFLANVRN